MKRIYIKPNTKDVNGSLVPLLFFEGMTYLVEEKGRTSVIQCRNKQVEILTEYIKKP